MSEESEAVCCKGDWPGCVEYPTVEPGCFWSETPVEGYDFIAGEKDVPPHRCIRPTKIDNLE